MGEQPLPVRGARPIGALAEEDVLADGEGVGAHHFRELPGVAVGVQADLAEVVAELLFEVAADAQVQGLAGAADDVLRLGVRDLAFRSRRLRRFSAAVDWLLSWVAEWDVLIGTHLAP